MLYFPSFSPNDRGDSRGPRDGRDGRTLGPSFVNLSDDNRPSGDRSIERPSHVFFSFRRRRWYVFARPANNLNLYNDNISLVVSASIFGLEPIFESIFLLWEALMAILLLFLISLRFSSLFFIYIIRVTMWDPVEIPFLLDCPLSFLAVHTPSSLTIGYIFHLNIYIFFFRDSSGSREF